MDNGQSLDSDTCRGSLKSYLIGYALSLILTLIPFALVMYSAVSPSAIVAGIGMAAVVQVLVHLYYFLHLDSSPGQRWNALAFVFTVIFVVLIVGGSLWIMYNLNLRLMVQPGFIG
jgi:cytochrome o ubiquinol oxidase subunit IV